MLGSLSERFMMISCGMRPWCLPRPPLSVRFHTLARLALRTRRHGGTVAAYSKGPGKGSVFTICLATVPA
jgi:hypothetical protein